VCDGEPAFIITPDTLFVCRGGNIQYGKATIDAVSNQDFIPPEIETLQQGPLTEADVERVHIRTCFMTYFSATLFRLVTCEQLLYFIQIMIKLYATIQLRLQVLLLMIIFSF